MELMEHKAYKVQEGLMAPMELMEHKVHQVPPKYLHQKFILTVQLLHRLCHKTVREEYLYHLRVVCLVILLSVVGLLLFHLNKISSPGLVNPLSGSYLSGIESSRADDDTWSIVAYGNNLEVSANVVCFDN